MKIVLIGLAGLAGTLGRYWVATAVASRYEGRLPLDTLVVNAAGCFAAGFLFHVMRERLHAGETVSAAVMVGLLGGFTTFSAYTSETRELLLAGRAPLAMTYLFGTLAVCLTATWAGMTLTRRLTVPRPDQGRA